MEFDDLRPPAQLPVPAVPVLEHQVIDFSKPPAEFKSAIAQKIQKIGLTRGSEISMTSSTGFFKARPIEASDLGVSGVSLLSPVPCGIKKSSVSSNSTFIVPPPAALSEYTPSVEIGAADSGQKSGSAAAGPLAESASLMKSAKGRDRVRDLWNQLASVGSDDESGDD
jgi:hypothetical protein